MKKKFFTQSDIVAGAVIAIVAVGALIVYGTFFHSDSYATRPGIEFSPN